MSASNAFEQELLALIFHNSGIALIGDATGIPASATVGSLYVSLYTGDPTEAGDQTGTGPNETTYTGYARQPVARTTGGWTLSAGQVVNAATITFPPSTLGTPLITHFGVGASISGAGLLLVSGILTASQTINLGGVNSFAAGALVVTLD